MKKRIFITIGLLCSVLLTGCGAVSDGGQSTSQVSSASEAEATTLVAEYSNLVDTDAQEKVDALLADAGISAARREVFRNHVVQFNDSVDTAVLQSGFASGDLLSPKYDAYELQEQWAAVHPNFNGYNCRITAFSLLADFLNVGKDGDIRADELFMDQESLQQEEIREERIPAAIFFCVYGGYHRPNRSCADYPKGLAGAQDCVCRVGKVQLDNSLVP